MTSKSEANCPFCLNKINPGAKKCHHCREWLTDSRFHEPLVIAEYEPKGGQDCTGIDFLSFQGRLAGRFPSVNYWFFYLALSIVLFSIIAIYWTYSIEDSIYLVSFFMYAIQMFFSSAGVVWFEGLLERFKHEIPGITGWNREKSEEFFQKAKKHIFADRHSFITAAVICTAAIVGDLYLVGSPFKNETSSYFFVVYEALYLFWTASLMAVFFKFAMFVRGLGDLELHILLIQEENGGIRMLGKLLLRTALFVVIPYFLGIFARQLGGWNFNLALVGWFVCFGLIILWYLFYPIYNIHLAMIKERDRKLSLVAVALNRYLSKGQIENENIYNIRNLIEIRNHIQSVETWPFDMSKVVGLLSALVIPMVSIIVDRFLKG
ncbi:MAG: hypothetical protein AB1403_14560 [Candidatus Riflebacteria bacterium]